MSAVAQEKTPPAVPGPREVKIVSHSMLFYWWPVWAIGLLMAFLTYLDGHLLAIVPKGTEAKEGLQVSGDPRDALVLPPNEHVTQPTLHVASHSGYGVVAGVVLLLVIFITNVPIRGMTSVVAVITLFLMSIILALTGGWDYIFEFLDHSHIFVNAFGYLAIAVPLLVLWLLAVLIFDRQTYMVFTPGQLRVHQNIGGGEVAYDTLGMVVEKRRSDLFRHWILGIGSGDLIVRTAGAQVHTFDLPNVLSLGRRVKEIEELLRSRQVIAGP